MALIWWVLFLCDPCSKKDQNCKAFLNDIVFNGYSYLSCIGIMFLICLSIMGVNGLVCLFLVPYKAQWTGPLGYTSPYHCPKSTCQFCKWWKTCCYRTSHVQAIVHVLLPFPKFWLALWACPNTSHAPHWTWWPVPGTFHITYWLLKGTCLS